MNRGDKSAKKALRCQQQSRAQQQAVGQKKKRDISTAPKYFSGGPCSKTAKDSRAVQCDTAKGGTLEVEGIGNAKAAQSAVTEYIKSQSAQRKLSDASNASEDLSKDSGCVSGKLSSDSSSEISDYASESTKPDFQSSDTELSWIDGKAYVCPDGSTGIDDDDRRETQDNGTLNAGFGNNFPINAHGGYLDVMMAETAEDLVREVEDLRSENEYLKDEMEGVRCEMLEMRDMFHEDEVHQLQELRLQLEQANKTCRVLHYRLRKAERRSIRVAQTGQVDGELVRSLEHDIRVAKSVSVRLHNELESVQKKNSQLELENEALREKTQQLEVVKQVLQAEIDKATSRESSLRRKNVRSLASRAEKRLSQQIEDDSADLKCQLHFAKEELAHMCKKLTKLVSESEGMREALAKYHSAYGDIDTTQSLEGKANSVRARGSEVKVHLKLVEEEATLLSCRIVELEVENRGLREEMSNLREKVAGGGGEEEGGEEAEEGEEEEMTEVAAENGERRERGLKSGSKQGECENSTKGKSGVEVQTEGGVAACHITREGPVGGEWDPSDSQESAGDGTGGRGLRGLTVKDCETLLALRDHSCIVSSAIQLLTLPPKNSHCASPPVLFKTDTDSKGVNEALAILQTMLVVFIGRVENVLSGKDWGGISLENHGPLWGSYFFSFRSGDSAVCVDDSLNAAGSPGSQESVEDLRTLEVKERAKRAQQGPPSHRGLFHSGRDPKMQMTLQILWILHQWCEVKEPGSEENEARDKIMDVLRRLLGEIGADGRIECDSKAIRRKANECALSAIFDDERSEIERVYNSKGNYCLPQFSPCSPKRRYWCYLSQEAAQLDREDTVKTWDHPIMPLSFPDLNFEEISMERCHTAPERTALRIYYSPPSVRRVQLAQLRQSPFADRGSVSTVSPWCTPPSSFSALCLGLPSNLSDDMKEMTAGWTQPACSNSLEMRRGRLSGGWVDVACSETQTQIQPQMVSVGLQTDGPQSVASVRNSSSRALNSSLVSARTHRISTSLERIPGRGERPKPTSTSPKLYRRHSASCLSTLPSSANFSSSLSLSSTPAVSREGASWSLSQQGHTGTAWTRPTNTRVGEGHNNNALNSVVSNSRQSSKPPGKLTGTNRCGLVTEFLRRVSGRAEKAGPGTGQKGKTGLKNLERIPNRPPAVPLQRNDSITRIVNQRFMKVREEGSPVQREQKGNSPNQAVRGAVSRDHTFNTITAEDGNYECSSRSTLTFCFARPSRSTQQQSSNQSKLQRHRLSPAVSMSREQSVKGD